MKKARGKRIVLICIVALIAALGWSIAWADFYVAAAGKKGKKTIMVSPESTATASGTALLNAVNGITDAGVTNPYLIIIEPGIYDIGSSSLQMKAYVDIQGSGECVTKITGNISDDYAGVLMGANNAELRFLTVENTGGAGSYSKALYNSSVSPAITHVTAIASGSSSNYAISNKYSSFPTMTNVTAIGSGGYYNYGVYSNNSSPTMTNVSATASGTTATGNYAVQNTNSASPTMTNVTAEASGGSNNFGVFNTGASTMPTITNVTATASGGSNNYGVHNASSASPTMTNVTATASGGTNDNYGVHNTTSANATIDHCVLSGDDYALYSIASGVTTYIGKTWLNGGVGGYGINVCAGVYDGDFTFYANTCP